MTESGEELKGLLMRVKKESEKASLKLNIKKKKRKTKIMASGDAIQGKKWKQLQVLFSQAPKSLWTVIAAIKFKATCSLEGRL